MENKEEPEYQFDLSTMQLASKLNEVHQEGNFLVGTTEFGVKFRHRLPAGKMIDKNENGDWILKDLRVSTDS